MKKAAPEEYNAILSRCVLCEEPATWHLQMFFGDPAPVAHAYACDSHLNDIRDVAIRRRIRSLLQPIGTKRVPRWLLIILGLVFAVAVVLPYLVAKLAIVLLVRLCRFAFLVVRYWSSAEL